MAVIIAEITTPFFAGGEFFVAHDKIKNGKNINAKSLVFRANTNANVDQDNLPLSAK